MDPPGASSCPIQRFVGFDVHRAYVMVAAVDAHQQVVLAPKRVALPDLPTWIARHLTPTDAVTLEATGNAWTIYDLLESQVGHVAVVSPCAGYLRHPARSSGNLKVRVPGSRLG